MELVRECAVAGAASVAASKLIASLLFNAGPSGPPTFAAVRVLLLVVSVVAGYLTAVRAAWIASTNALRAERD